MRCDKTSVKDLTEVFLLASVGSQAPVDRSEPEGTRRDASQPLAIVGICLSVVAVVVSVLAVVASIAAAMLVLGLMVGLVGGVLLSPFIGSGAQRVADYLPGNRAPEGERFTPGVAPPNE